MIRLEVTFPGHVGERIIEGDTVTIGAAADSDIVVDSGDDARVVDLELRILGGRVAMMPRSSAHAVIDGSGTSALLEVGDKVRVGDAVVRLLEYGPDSQKPERVRPCLQCGAIISFRAESCPHCAATVSSDRRSAIHRRRIKGYELRRRIGGGGMGIVYEALRFADGRVTAIKVMRPEIAHNSANLVRFVEEMRALSLLNHPNIVQIYDRGTQGALAYMDMELVKGDAVRTIMRRSGPLAERQAIEIVWQMTLALDYAAQKRIIHGDVKPSNFLLDETGRAKLCDFGLAVLRGPYAGGPMGRRESSGRKGTAAYAAPELFDSGEPPTIQSDIFSMGASLFHMLTGQLPFGLEGQHNGRRSARPLPDARDFVKTIRPAVCMLMEKMTDSEPSRRHASYRELLDDLGLLLSR